MRAEDSNRPPIKIGLDTPAFGYQVSRAAFNESPAMMTAAVEWGYKFLYGRKTTVRHYRAWRRDNPTFTSTSYVAKHSKTVRERLEKQRDGHGAGKGHGQRRAGRRGATAHSSHAQ